MTVRIVTDSTAGLPDDVIASLGITVVPLYVLFGQQSLRDGVDIMPDEVYARLPDAKPHPTTSQPSTGDFEAAYRALAAEADAIVSIHLSGKLSGTVGSALTAKAAGARGADRGHRFPQRLPGAGGSLSPGRRRRPWPGERRRRWSRQPST